eukprot:sb/3469930/
MFEWSLVSSVLLILSSVTLLLYLESRFKLPHPQSSVPSELHVPSSVLNRSVEAVIERSNVQRIRIISREAAEFSGKHSIQESTDTSKQTIRTRRLGHVTGYQPIKDQYFQIPFLHIIIKVKVVQVHDSTLYESLEHGHKSGNEGLQIVYWFAAELELVFVSSCCLNYLCREIGVRGLWKDYLVPAERGLKKCQGGKIALFKHRAWRERETERIEQGK